MFLWFGWTLDRTSSSNVAQIFFQSETNCSPEGVCSKYIKNKKLIIGIISCHLVMILHGFFTSYFVLEGNCNVSTSMCPWQMQCAVTLHPPLASSNLVAYFVPLQAQNAHSRILGSVPTNSDFGPACKVANAAALQYKSYAVSASTNYSWLTGLMQFSFIISQK